jgi:glycosyltransferase involved in cell wall biosynthesis
MAHLCRQSEPPMKSGTDEYEPGLVSVILTTLGTRDLGATVASLHEQTYQHYELITVLDDQRRGAPWARNRGERSALGEYLLFLDDDVVLHAAFLDEMVHALTSETDCGYAYSHYRRIGLFNDVSRAYLFDERRLRRCNYVSTMSLMRHEVFVPWDERLTRFQDWDMWLTLLEQEHRGVLIDRVLFEAHYDDSGITDPDEIRTRIQASRVRMKHGMVIGVLLDAARILFLILKRTARAMASAG